MTREEFDELVEEQSRRLDDRQLKLLEQQRVEPRQVLVKRTKTSNYEPVWILAEKEDGVLYFDEVEWGWNGSALDEHGRILHHACGQTDLADTFFPPSTRPS